MLLFLRCDVNGKDLGGLLSQSTGDTLEASKLSVVCYCMRSFEIFPITKKDGVLHNHHG